MKDPCPRCRSGLARVPTPAGLLCHRCAADLTEHLEGDR